MDVLVLVSVFLTDVGVHARRCHERGADGLDLFHVAELLPVQDLIKVADEFV